MFKKLAIPGVTLLLLVISAMPAWADSGQPQLHGRAALLLDGISGQILYQQNAGNQNFPASTTKLLTALVAVEHGKLDQLITVSARAVDQAPDSSSCYLEQGEQQSLENLLYGLLLASGNDCAIAIAEGVTNGQPEQFSTWMNETARRLGATNSNFTNPHGLHEADHYTTALDLALIAKGALANPTVRKMAGTKEFHWPGKSERNGIYYNHNQLLFTYDGTIGGKTGFTEEAGLTLVSAAERNGHLLIGVVMGEQWKSEQYNDMAAILDYGFAQFEQKSLLAAGAVVDQMPVENGLAESVTLVTQEPFYISVPRTGESNVTFGVRREKSVTAPVEANRQLGVLEVREGKRLIASLPAVAQLPVDAKPAFEENLRSGVLTGLKWFAYVLGGLLLFRTVVKTIRRMLRRRSRNAAGQFRHTSGRAGSIPYYRPNRR